MTNSPAASGTVATGVATPDELGGGFTPEADAGQLKRRSAMGAAWTLAGQGTKFVLQFGSQVALARLLLPTDFGLLAMVGPLVTAALLLTDLGLSAATVQRPTINQTELSSLFWLNVLIGTGLAVLTVVLSPLAAIFYHTPAVQPIMATMAVALLLSSLAAQHLAILNRRMRFGAIAMIEVGALTAGVVAGLTGALLGLGYWSLVLMQIVNGVATLAMAWGFSRWWPSRPGIAREAMHLLRFGGTVTGYNLLGYLITNLDNILIGARFGAGPLGIYDRAYKLMFQPLWQMTAPAARVAVPLLSRLNEDEREYRGAYLALLGGILSLTTPGILCAIVFAGPIIEVLLGARWAASAPIFAWLGVAALTLQLRQAASWLFISQGRAAEQLKWGGLGSVVIVVGYLIGIFWGPKGVAMSAAISSGLVQIPVMWWAVTRCGPVNRRDAVRLMTPLIAATAICGGVLAVLAQRIDWTSLPMLALAGILAYVVFGAALTLFPTGRAQLRRIVEIARKAVRRG
ncbi:lipopolysaccharide biosynthesis protein [Novosphingobium sp. 9]|uniref:lipopolysaccharide biosynthesis protein n=1 Tax=Novosphingobium sp. 9 TaxID=2025349 RepID=UPI0021B50E1C|nr:lipopolysaccharide biosynthesis protein [Novosphingobium sp. 9]